MITEVVLSNGEIMTTDYLGHERIESNMTQHEFRTWCANVVTYAFWLEARKLNRPYFDKVVTMVFRYNLTGKSMLALCEANALYVPLDDATYTPVFHSNRTQEEEEDRAKSIFKREPATSLPIPISLMLP